MQLFMHLDKTGFSYDFGMRAQSNHNLILPNQEGKRACEALQFRLGFPSNPNCQMGNQKRATSFHKQVFNALESMTIMILAWVNALYS